MIVLISLPSGDDGQNFSGETNLYFNLFAIGIKCLSSGECFSISVSMGVPSPWVLWSKKSNLCIFANGACCAKEDAWVRARLASFFEIVYSFSSCRPDVFC